MKVETRGRPVPKPEAGRQERVARAEWSPLVDITEDGREYLLKVELPEVKREDLKVRVGNGVLSISGEREFEQEEKTRKHHRVERSCGSFLRSFTLPGETSADKVTADYQDGVLRVHLAKVKPAPFTARTVNVT